MAAPLAANAARSVATKAAGSAGSRAAGARAASAAGKTGGKGAALAAAAPGGGGGGGRGSGAAPARGGGGDAERPWRNVKEGKGKTLKLGSGSQGSYRKALIAEFLVCLLLLAFSPLAKGPGEMGPIRFMKRGTATAALFVILGLVSSAGAGAAKACAMFGGLVTLVLLVDQREAFGKLAEILTREDDETGATQSSLGPPDDNDVPDSVGGPPPIVEA